VSYTPASAEAKARQLNPTAIAWEDETLLPRFRYCLRVNRDGVARVFTGPTWLEVLERFYNWQTEVPSAIQKPSTAGIHVRGASADGEAVGGGDAEGPEAA
jgi:hypothetical protein